MKNLLRLISSWTSAFVPSEESKESTPMQSMTVEEDKEIVMLNAQEAARQTVAEDEMEFLDAIKMKRFPEDEALRRKAWMDLPRATRAAIHRMHHPNGHNLNSVLVHLLRGARAGKRLIDGVSELKKRRLRQDIYGIFNSCYDSAFFLHC